VLEHAIRAIDHGLPVRAEMCLGPELLAALKAAVQAEGSTDAGRLLARLPSGTRREEVQVFLKAGQQGERAG
jgi:hypothetical protein